MGHNSKTHLFTPHTSRTTFKTQQQWPPAPSPCVSWSSSPWWHVAKPSVCTAWVSACTEEACTAACSATEVWDTATATACRVCTAWACTEDSQECTEACGDADTTKCSS